MENKIRIVILSETRLIRKKTYVIKNELKNKKESTSSKLYKFAKSKGFETYSCKINGAYISSSLKKDKILSIHNEDDKNGFLINNSTIIIVRGLIVQKKSYLALISQLEDYGVSVINSRKCIETCADKYLTYLNLFKNGINQPRTVLIPNDSKLSVSNAAKKLKNKFPVVLKTLQGSKGVGVVLIESLISLQSTIQLFNKFSENSDIILQEYIKTKYDIRVVIVKNKIIAAVKRKKVVDDFRSNISQGSIACKIKLTKLESEICIKVAKSVSGCFVGVDFIPSSDRKNKEPYILEVNHSPGTQGVSQAMGREISEEAINIILNEKNKIKKQLVCGVLETITCDGEIMTAKMDTGNSTSSCALDVEYYKVDRKNKQVTYKRNKKLITKKIKRFIKLVKPETTRPVIECEINFLGSNYIQDVSLDQRNKVPFLVNLKFMKKINIVVNPKENFLMTKKEK